MQRDYNGYKYHTFVKKKKVKTSFSLIRILKSKKKKLALTLFYCLSQETSLDDSCKRIYKKQSRFYNFFTWQNSKMFSITSKYFSIFNNKPPAS